MMPTAKELFSMLAGLVHNLLGSRQFPMFVIDRTAKVMEKMAKARADESGDPGDIAIDHMNMMVSMAQSHLAALERYVSRANVLLLEPGKGWNRRYQDPMEEELKKIRLVLELYQLDGTERGMLIEAVNLLRKYEAGYVSKDEAAGVIAKLEAVCKTDTVVMSVTQVKAMVKEIRDLCDADREAIDEIVDNHLPKE